MSSALLELQNNHTEEILNANECDKKLIFLIALSIPSEVRKEFRNFV